MTGPEAERARIATLDTGVGEGDTVRLGAHEASVMTVPGHTQGHVVFHFAGDAAIFTGDTLFAMGCGRLFEGTAEDMFGNTRRYAALAPETRVYCGHEYVQSNGRYALVAEPGNTAICERMVRVDAARAAGEATVSTTIGEELATNPFLRARDVATLAGKARGEGCFPGLDAVYGPWWGAMEVRMHGFLMAFAAVATIGGRPVPRCPLTALAMPRRSWPERPPA